MTTDHQPLPPTEHHMFRDRMVVLQCGLYLFTGCTGSGVFWVVQAKISSHVCSSWVHPAWAIKQSEMASTCVGLGDSQVKPSYESRLAAPSARHQAT